MIKDIITYNNKAYQLSTINIDGMFETMIFPIINGNVSGNEVYCFRTFKSGESKNKHADIYYYPEKYLSEDAIDEYLRSKGSDFTVDNKIYIVMGYINESGDEDQWVEELFEDKEQASACCEYLNITNTQDNVNYYLCESDGFCTEDYISKLEALTN